MAMARPRSRPAALAAALLLLTACSGGKKDEPAPGPLAVSVGGDALAWAVLVGGTLPPRTVTLTLTSGTGAYYGAVVLDRAGVLDASIAITGATSGSVTFTPIAPAAGRLTGTVHLALCTDPQCGSVAWSTDLPYGLTAFSLQPDTLRFSAIEGQVPSPQSIAITPADTDDVLALAPLQGASWLSVTKVSPTRFDVTASGAGHLAPGPRSGLRPTLRGGPGVASGLGADLPVALDLSPGLVTPAGAGVTLDAGAAAAEVPGSLQIAFAGGLTPAWTATADQPWLHLGQPGGTGPGPLPFTVDGAALAVVPNGGSTAATVTVASAGLTSVTAQVAVQKRLGEVYLVHPAAVVAGRAATLRVFGKGFAAIADPAAIEVTGAPGATCTVVSDREAAVSLPAMAAGRTEVKVRNPFGGTLPTADLAAVATAWSAAAVARAGEVRSAFFDATRSAVFAVDRTNEALVRYRQGVSGWVVDALAVPGMGDAGPSADRRTVYVTQPPDKLLAVSPDSLTVRDTVTVTDLEHRDLLAVGWSMTPGLQVTNDARLWFPSSGFASLIYLDLLTGSFQRYAGASSSERPNGPRYLASPDGSRMAVVPGGAGPDLLYATGAGAWGFTDLPWLGHMAWSADGSLVSLGAASVHRAPDWTLVGNATVTAPELGGPSQFSPDGTRLYVVALSSGTEYRTARVEVFDTTQVTPGTTDLVKLGEISVVDSAAACSPSAPSDCGFVPHLMIGPLGDALFMAGNRGLVVVPIPPALRGG